MKINSSILGILITAISMTILGCSDTKTYSIDDLVVACKNNQTNSFCKKLLDTDLDSIKKDSGQLILIDGYPELNETPSDEELIDKISKALNQENNRELKIQLAPYLNNIIKEPSKLGVCLRTAVSFSPFSVIDAAKIIGKVSKDPIVKSAILTNIDGANTFQAATYIDVLGEEEKQFWESQERVRKQYYKFYESYNSEEPSIIHNLLSCSQIMKVQ